MNKKTMPVIVNDATPIQRHGQTGRGAPRRHNVLYNWLPKLEDGQELRLPFSDSLRSAAVRIAKQLGVKVFTQRDGNDLRIYKPRPEDSI